MSKLYRGGIILGAVVIAGAAVPLARLAHAQVVVQRRPDRLVVQAPGVQGLLQRMEIGRQIGVEIRDLRPDDKKGETGVLVTGVVGGSPAEKAGIKQGDVITEFDGERVRSAAQFQRLVRETPPDHAAKVAMLRDGKRVEVTVTPEENRGAAVDRGDLERQLGQLDDRLRSFRLDEQQLRDLEDRLRRELQDRQFNFRLQPPNQYWYWNEPPGQQAPRGPFAPPPSTRGGQLGVTVQDLTPQLGDYFGTRDGVLVTGVQDNSPAAGAGLKAGDVITAIDGKTIHNRSELTRELGSGSPDRTVSVTVMRDHKPQTFKVKLGGVRIVPL
jgi:C-terminal processing protease CtpA/Prc